MVETLWYCPKYGYMEIRWTEILTGWSMVDDTDALFITPLGIEWIKVGYL